VVGTAATGDAADALMPTLSLITALTRTPSHTMQASPATISLRITTSRTITPVGITDGAMAGVGDVAGVGARAVVGGDEAGKDQVIGERAMRADGGPAIWRLESSTPRIIVNT
jgi:hypothetical protein